MIEPSLFVRSPTLSLSLCVCVCVCVCVCECVCLSVSYLVVAALFEVRALIPYCATCAEQNLFYTVMVRKGVGGQNRFYSMRLEVGQKRSILRQGCERFLF